MFSKIGWLSPGFFTLFISFFSKEGGSTLIQIKVPCISNVQYLTGTLYTTAALYTFGASVSSAVIVRSNKKNT